VSNFQVVGSSPDVTLTCWRGFLRAGEGPKKYKGKKKKKVAMLYRLADLVSFAFARNFELEYKTLLLCRPPMVTCINLVVTNVRLY
jgi:hypothetical protein